MSAQRSLTEGKRTSPGKPISVTFDRSGHAACQSYDCRLAARSEPSKVGEWPFEIDAALFRACTFWNHCAARRVGISRVPMPAFGFQRLLRRASFWQRPLRGESPLECAPVIGDGEGLLIMRRLWVRRFNLGIPL